MRKVSLIVATLGERSEDLCALLHSLAPQAKFLSEIIIVDQHSDPERLPRLLVQFQGILPIRHARSERGLSRARNHGLSMITGSIVAFPDDDCLYSQGLLEWVTNWFEANVEYDILAVGVKDGAGVSSGNRWPQDACDIRPVNAFRTTFSSSLFLCTDLARTARFDVQLGVGAGTAYGSGEETDYVLRLLGKRARGRFDRSHFVIHPRRDMLSGTASLPRAQAYGFGMGHVLRMHSLRGLWLTFMAYNLGRACICLLRGNQEGAELCVAQTKGLWKGFLAPRHERIGEAAAPHVMKPRDVAREPQVIQFVRPQQQNDPAQAKPHSAGSSAREQLAETNVGSSPG